MEFEFLRLSVSSNSDHSEDELYYVRQGDYTRFDSFDDDIEVIKSNVSLDNKSLNSGKYFQYDCIDDIVIVNPETETNNLANSKADETDVNQNISPELASKYDEEVQELQVSNTIKSEKVLSTLEVFQNKTDKTDVDQQISLELAHKYDEVVQEIKELQVSNTTKTEKVLSPLEVLRKRLQKRMSNDFSKFTKRPSFLHKLKSENYNGIFRRKSKKLYRTSSVPKIVVFSPSSPGHYTDSGNDSDSSDDVNIFKKQLDRLEKWSTNQKLHVSSKKKAMRKSI